MIITLCGSTNFTEQMLIHQWDLTKAGHVVLTWCVLPTSYFDDPAGDHTHIGDKENVMEIIDHVHKQKIDMSDEIHVINVNDYIGESTKSEILHAIRAGKPVRYIYPHVERDWECNWSKSENPYSIQIKETERKILDMEKWNVKHIDTVKHLLLQLGYSQLMIKADDYELMFVADSLLEVRRLHDLSLVNRKNRKDIVNQVMHELGSISDNIEAIRNSRNDIKKLKVQRDELEYLKTKGIN